MGHVASQFEPLDPDLADENELVTLIPLLMEDFFSDEPQPQSISVLTGRLYVEELLRGNMHTFRSVARMDKETFTRLTNLLREAGLDDTPHISVEEKILIHIQVCCGLSNRNIMNRFQHSGDTISKIVREVIAVMRSIDHIFMVPPTEDTPLDARIANDPKFFPYFENCIGCWDGTHVPAVVFGADALGGRFRDRKGNISQNVLGVVNFDMTFQYVLAGWEGSAHDGRVLRDSRNKGLPFLIGKFHLGDAGYALTMQCLVPYRGVRYHLKVCFHIQFLWFLICKDVVAGVAAWKSQATHP